MSNDPLRQLTGAPLRRPGSQTVPGATSEPRVGPAPGPRGLAAMDPQRQHEAAQEEERLAAANVPAPKAGPPPKKKTRG